MNKCPASLDAQASVMDSAHAELLASEAWRNICDTFLLTVLPLAAAAQGKWGLFLPRWVQRQLSERLARLPRRISLLLRSFSLGPPRCHVSSVNVKKKKVISVRSMVLFVSPGVSDVVGSFSLPENLHISHRFGLCFAVVGISEWAKPFSHLKLMWHCSPFLLAWRRYIC